MAEHEIRLSGKHAVIALVVLACIVGYRLVSVGKHVDDPELLKQIEQLLRSDYYPDQVAALTAAQAAGDAARMSALADDIVNSGLDIRAVNTSYPLFDFSMPRDVVVRVTYSVGGLSGEPRTRYYLFRQGALGDWRYQRDSGAVWYYLNFT